MGPNGGRSSDFAEGKTMEAVSTLNPDQVTADLNAAADYALKFPLRWKLFVGATAGVAVKHSASRPTAVTWRPLRLLRRAAGEGCEARIKRQSTLLCLGMMHASSHHPDTITQMKAAGKRTTR